MGEWSCLKNRQIAVSSTQLQIRGLELEIHIGAGYADVRVMHINVGFDM